MRKLRLMPRPVADEDGVCSGLAYWVGIPTGLVRTAFIIGLFASGVSILIYWVLSETLGSWKEVPEDYEEVTGS